MKMTYEEIYSHWAKDGEIVLTDISEATANIPKIQNKYLKWYQEEGLKLRRLKAEYKVLTKLKTEYYNGNMDSDELKRHNWKPQPLKILRQDIPMHVEADEDIITLSLKIGAQELVVDYLENIIKHINNRNFTIKNIIDYEKFKHGG